MQDPDAPTSPARSPRIRSAPRARETSDVTRFRGVWLASVAGAVAVLTGLWISLGSSALISPGPLSPGHTAAGLECQSCHSASPALLACQGCHPGHASRRSGHRQQSADGALECATCHTPHGGAVSLVFARNQVARVQRGTDATDLSVSGYQPSSDVFLPLVPSAACQECHGLGEADRAHLCFVAGEFQTCFDEHRAPGGPPSDRDPAWAAAERVLWAGVVAPKAGPASGWLLAIGCLVAGLVLVGKRRFARGRAGEPNQALSVTAPTRRRLPQINTTTCLGCYACVDACPFDVLEVKRFVAVVARPDACCGLSLCEQRCPNGSLVIREGEPLSDTPRLAASLESLDVPGLFLAGDLTGLSLIRNAINQGAHIVEGLSERRRREPTRGADVYDLVVVGTGPAGLSAILEAHRAGLRALALEQGSVAESIRSFPRHKLVLDQGTQPHERASLWLEQCEKEDLVAKWTQTARRERLPILEQHRVVGIERRERGPARFLLRAQMPEGEREFFAEHVVLALGKRGSPRKLEVAIPEAWLSHVHYALVDARPFAGRKVLVVGLGDTAMEAAVALAGQPGCEVTLAARASEFRRGKARNIEAVLRLAAMGKLTLLFNSSVTGFTQTGVQVQVGEATQSVPVSSVFVLIGTRLPWELLEELGVRRGALPESPDQNHAQPEPQ